jgi:hypothetical protein
MSSKTDFDLGRNNLLFLWQNRDAKLAKRRSHLKDSKKTWVISLDGGNNASLAILRSMEGSTDLSTTLIQEESSHLNLATNSKHSTGSKHLSGQRPCLIKTRLPVEIVVTGKIVMNMTITLGTVKNIMKVLRQFVSHATRKELGQGSKPRRRK